MGFWDLLWRSVFGDGDGPSRGDVLEDAQTARRAGATLTEPTGERRATAAEPEGEHWWTPDDDALSDAVPLARRSLVPPGPGGPSARCDATDRRSSSVVPRCARSAPPVSRPGEDIR